MLLLPAVDGDARIHITSRGTTVHHVVMLSVLLLLCEKGTWICTIHGTTVVVLGVIGMEELLLRR